FTLVIDIRELLGAARTLPDSNYVKWRARTALEKINEVLMLYPKHATDEEFANGIKQALAISRPFFTGGNSRVFGKVGITGHSHMDTAWLWPVSETIRKCARTYANALNLMEQYPSYRFMQSSALHSEWMKDYYPSIFEDMKKRVAEGRYEPNGGVYVECDCNITSGELMVRQFLKGQQFTRENFNYTADAFWLPDTFGYNANIPQIMQGSEVKYFCTTKIGWNETNRFPFESFVWKGIDGSEVLTHFMRIHCWPDVRDCTDGVNSLSLKDSTDMRLLSYGFGDGGGGPTAAMVETSLRSSNMEGLPVIESMSVSAFMKELEKGKEKLPVYRDELYLELHRGTLTQLHEVKRKNRKAEYALHDMEYFNVLSGRPRNPESDKWLKILLKNQFHDILPGTCMERAASEQLQQIGGIRHAARSVTAAALRRLAADTSVPRPAAPDRPAALPFFVFNPHPWPYRGQIELEGCLDDRPGYRKEFGDGQPPLDVRGPSRRRIPYQIVPAEAQFGDVIWRSRVVIEADIPAEGFAIYTMGWDVKGEGHATRDKRQAECRNTEMSSCVSHVDCSMSSIVSGHFAVSARLGAKGIRILRDGKPWLKGRGLQALLFHDAGGSWGDNAPRQYDESVPPVAWAVERAEVVESGLLRSALWVRLAGERSWLEMTLRLAAGSDAIYIDARLLWNEREALLKLAMPCGAAMADCAVPGAVVRRGAAVGEFPAAPWIRALGKAGLPVLGFASDALYGCDIAGGALRPSVVRASGYAYTPRDGRPMDVWRPATDLGEHRFRFLLAPGGADLPRLAAELEMPPAVQMAHVSSSGPLGRFRTLTSRDAIFHASRVEETHFTC
ncbi:MAG: alpha-mannosidase, partial [Kiritimatiellae bacterium]|nr:alpha-mannosidase [Kiritimatiellia bacterium]